ncbi:hypothetical protein [Nostoc sp.]
MTQSLLQTRQLIYLQLLQTLVSHTLIYLVGDFIYYITRAIAY